MDLSQKVKLSVVIPCYNEEKTLAKCVSRVCAIADEKLELEIIIVDDGSTDNSKAIAQSLQRRFSEVKLISKEKNAGKGAALRTGFQCATGDFVAVQDADLEYDPQDLKRLLVPLIKGDADVVLGSRFLSSGAHRVLYFWHYLGNRFLTLFSNMFTDLNLTDMETCYKVIRREILQAIDIKENRFGFEPEIVAKIASMRFRIYEMGISYYGRTYEEGKKIGVKDGFRALYCIMRYGGHKAPVPVQFLIYVFIGGVSALINLFVFLGLLSLQCTTSVSVVSAFIIAAGVNYFLCILLLFRHNARWNSWTEVLVYIGVVCTIGLFDLWSTRLLLGWGWMPASSKVAATFLGLLLNYSARRAFVFPEVRLDPWQPQYGSPEKSSDIDLE